MDHLPIWLAQPNYGHPHLAETVAEEEEMKHMFEKTLTPSDVGKLNRLVIPKQHAERYFPIGSGSGSNNSGVNFENLLSFEDESGKSWEFRYSYWNSSQSYVLTKGWSRYVKEKALYTGDIVVFMQLRANQNRKFIVYQRKIATSTEPPMVPVAQPSGGPRAQRVRYPSHTDHAYAAPSTYSSQSHPLFLNPGVVLATQKTPSNGQSKTLRLFGVNVEYQLEPSQSDVPVQSENENPYEQYCPSKGHVTYARNYVVSS